MLNLPGAIASRRVENPRSVMRASIRSAILRSSPLMDGIETSSASRSMTGLPSGHINTACLGLAYHFRDVQLPAEIHDRGERIVLHGECALEYLQGGHAVAI